MKQSFLKYEIALFCLVGALDEYFPPADLNLLIAIGI